MDGQRLLVVDDEPFNLEIIGEYLEGSGLPFDTAADGEEAWRRLCGPTAYAAILLDRMMPVLDGLSLLRRIKEDPRLHSIPVIMQTAAGNPEQVKEGLAAGAYYYLVKPYERDSLLTIVRGALSDHQARAQLQQRVTRLDRALLLMASATFSFRTLEEAEMLAAMLAQTSPNPEAAILGISELLINAVEHGNLGISYDEKSQLKREDRWADEVTRRLSLPEYRDRRVRVQWTRTDVGTELRIEDEGCGFDWQRYLEFDPQRAFDPNGRGIALARMASFSALDYQGSGNTVVARLKQDD